MKRFTLFTFLYLALGVCLTAIALGYPNLPSGLQTSLLISAGASYIVCLLSTFPFWRETTIRLWGTPAESIALLSGGKNWQSSGDIRTRRGG